MNAQKEFYLYRNATVPINAPTATYIVIVASRCITIDGMGEGLAMKMRPSKLSV